MRYASSKFVRIALVVVTSLALISPQAIADEPISLLASKTRFLKSIPESKWIGKQVLFMEQRHGVRGDYAPGMPLKKFVGRKAIVKGFENKGETIILQMMDDHSVAKMPKVKSVFRDLLLLEELERAQKALQGKTFFEISNFAATYVWNQARQLGEGFDGNRFATWKVVSVEVGEDNDSPLKLTFVNKQGVSTYWKGSLSNTNRDPKHEYDFHMFERCFDAKDPKTVYKFPDSTWKAIANKQLHAGMTELQVILSKGKPPLIHDRSYMPDTDAMWSYFDDTFIGFKDGKVVKWETMSVGVAPGF